MAEFFDMGGYAFYVWGSYALAFIVLIWNFLGPLRRERQLMEQLRRQARRRVQ